MENVIIFNFYILNIFQSVITKTLAVSISNQKPFLLANRKNYYKLKEFIRITLILFC